MQAGTQSTEANMQGRRATSNEKSNHAIDNNTVDHNSEQRWQNYNKYNETKTKNSDTPLLKLFFQRFLKTSIEGTDSKFNVFWRSLQACGAHELKDSKRQFMFSVIIVRSEGFTINFVPSTHSHTGDQCCKLNCQPYKSTLRKLEFGLWCSVK